MSVFENARPLSLGGSQYVNPLQAGEVARLEARPKSKAQPAFGRAEGLRNPCEAGVTSGEAAGLVLFKTSPELQQLIGPVHWRNQKKTIKFDKSEQKIKRLKNLKKSIWLAGQLHQTQQNGFRPLQAHFVTLTYAKADDWRPNHISEATDRYRHWCKRRGYEAAYVWCAELTKTGRVHYHLICWLPAGKKMTFWDKPRRVKKQRTCAFWTHGMSNGQVAKHGVAYLMKYMSKMGEFHEFPEGLRLHGCGGLDKCSRAVKQWSNLPQWVKNGCGVGDIKRIGRYFVSVDGEILEPMFMRRFIPGGVEIHQLREMPEKVYDHGPFSTYPKKILVS